MEYLSEYCTEASREVYDASLASGRFPECWKNGKLVLLKKTGRPVDPVAACNPIELLEEAGNLFERVLSACIIRHWGLS